MGEVELLTIPRTFRTVDDVLGAAKHLNLPNVIVISELENGNIVLLETEMTVASANWLLDRLKAILLKPMERVGY